MTSKTLLIPPLLFLSGVATAWTQSAGAPKEEMIEFRAIAWNRDVPTMFYELKGKSQPLPLHRLVITEPQRYAGPEKLIFYVPTVIDGKTGKLPIAEVMLMPPPRKNLVVVWQEKTGSYGATVLADEPDSPSLGQLRFVNFTGQNLALKCNGMEQFQLPPGQNKTVSPPPGGIGVGVKMARQNKGKNNWELVLMSGISVEPNERVTAFIADPSRLALSPEEETNLNRDESEKMTLFFIRDRIVTK